MSRFRLAMVASVLCLRPAFTGPDTVWQSLSSKRGELPPPPDGSTQQTGAVVTDFDGDGLNDSILSFRPKPNALVWYRRTGAGWDQYVIEREHLTIETGGTVMDIDGDGDYQANEFAPNTPRVNPGPFWVDAKGNIWMAYGFFRYDFQGLDTQGNPRMVKTSCGVAVVEFQEASQALAGLDFPGRFTDSVLRSRK